jgi:hypothetical protein
MITWEYRVFREDDGTYVIREVFYDDDDLLTGCTESAVEPMGESLEELAKDIDSFKEALKLPVLTLADIPSRLRERRNRDRSKNLTSEQVRAELGLDKPLSSRQRTHQINMEREK